MHIYDYDDWTQNFSENLKKQSLKEEQTKLVSQCWGMGSGIALSVSWTQADHSFINNLICIRTAKTGIVSDYLCSKQANQLSLLAIDILAC